jgi:hypothetical protein
MRLMLSKDCVIHGLMNTVSCDAHGRICQGEYVV